MSHHNSFASTDEQIQLNEPQPLTLENQILISPNDQFIRTQAIFDYLHIPSETTDPNYFDQIGSNYNLAQLDKKLSWMDPTKTFLRFLKISGLDILLFQDIDAKNIADISYSLEHQSISPTLKEKILAAKKNPTEYALKGLKIALDPGHIGGDLWDLRAGKFVTDGNRKIGEGVINLQVCLLLKKELETLGAQVLITHDQFKPVSNIDYEHFDILPFAKSELRYQSLQPWFQAILSVAPPGQALYSAVDHNSEIKKLYSEKMRWNYYFKRADLKARAEMMMQFAPDITIFIHHDTSTDESHVNDKAPNVTRAYLPGGFDKVELSDRNSKKFFMQHWLDQDAWNLSVQLIRKTLGQVKTKMNIALAPFDGTGALKIEDGIFARNLVVPRHMKNTITAYYELFYYDRRAEFDALLIPKYKIQIGDQFYPYSERLKQSVESLRDGLIDFIRTAE